ncbi:p093 [Rhizobium phage 16-3]|uniref:p093 n=1 Tax=Rhizobium phage 16-3 TaxID=10704 RepID=UPI00017BA656|nr:p093 [Rhizobium phage 16-3]ABF71341.1 p093 [Rhizobium phage 16-3]
MDPEVLRKAVNRAAIRWCGEKDRETFMGDIIYFRANWSALPGLKKYVEEELAA